MVRIMEKYCTSILDNVILDSKNCKQIHHYKKCIVQQTKHLSTICLTCSTEEPKRKSVNREICAQSSWSC